MTEVDIGRREGAAREESGPIGVSEEGRDWTCIALIVLFWRSQQKDINLSGEAARELWRTMKSWMSMGVTGIMGGSERARSP